MKSLLCLMLLLLAPAGTTIARADTRIDIVASGMMLKHDILSKSPLCGHRGYAGLNRKGDVRVEIINVSCKKSGAKLAKGQIRPEPQFAADGETYVVSVISKSGLKIVQHGIDGRRLYEKLMQAQNSCPLTLQVSGDGQLRSSGDFYCNKFSEDDSAEEFVDAA